MTNEYIPCAEPSEILDWDYPRARAAQAEWVEAGGRVAGGPLSRWYALHHELPALKARWDRQRRDQHDLMLLLEVIQCCAMFQLPPPHWSRHAASKLEDAIQYGEHGGSRRLAEFLNLPDRKPQTGARKRTERDAIIFIELSSVEADGGQITHHFDALAKRFNIEPDEVRKAYYREKSRHQPTPENIQ